jgi:hypothetical protein
MADTIYAPDPWSDLRREYTVDHSDIRREQAVGFGDVKFAIAEHSEETNRDILQTGANTAVKVDEAADKIQQRAADFFIAEQTRDYLSGVELAKIAATQVAGFADIADRVVTSAEINALKTQLTVKEDGEITRGLINNLKNDELNRLLIERNTDVNHFRHGYWDALGAATNAQFASVASNLNAFQSQLAETRQGMVNFGTMAGNAGQQSSTSNQVR